MTLRTFRLPSVVAALIASTLVASLVVAPAAQTPSAPAAAKPQPTAAPTPPPAAAASKPAAAAATPAKPAAAMPTVDGGWPRSYATASGAEIVIYQPQIASWKDQKQLVGYSAVSYRLKGAEKPALGSIKIESDTSVALDDRLVSLANLRVTESSFQTLNRDQTRDVVAEITKTIPDDDRVLALDRVLASVDKSQIIPKDVPGVKADPPKIFQSTRPAILVNFDGEPVWSPIKENDLKTAVNTNWDVFHDEAHKAYYLRHNQAWLKASELTGAWTDAGKLPASFSKLPADENWAEVKKSLPGRALPAKERPTVFVSYQPAELILLQGAPSYLMVGTSRLLWVNNTESDLFRLEKTGPYFYLVTGRWFSAPDLAGPWTFATPTLPAEFKQIPLEHPRSRVLASVPGTPQAVEAVLLAQIPQTARIDKNNLKAPEVAYQGSPEFKPIETTTVERAVNTDKDVFKVGASYYLCAQGVWFTAAAATGPWQVATTVPSAIYQIPASSPAHHVTYVTVVDSSPNDQYVTVAYAGGYSGVMVAWGCAVWGSGWYYPPYIHYGGYYPIYYPYFPTYGYSAWYNPWSGTYGRSAVAYGPYGGMGATARYNPRTGTYARGAVAWGPYGAAGAAQAWNPRTGAYGQTRQGSNIYGSWGSTYVQRGDDWAQTSRVTNRVTGNTTRVTRTDEGAAISRRGPDGRTTVAAGEGGNIYAGHDGNVYRRQDGSWQKYDNGGWGSVDTPTPHNTAQAQQRAGQAATRPTATPTQGQLDRDRAARAEGAQRTRDYSSYRSAGSRSAGSYRGGGGGARGGGGRRR
jgi:hypothetical protein